VRCGTGGLSSKSDLFFRLVGEGVLGRAIGSIGSIGDNHKTDDSCDVFGDLHTYAFNSACQVLIASIV